MPAELELDFEVIFSQRRTLGITVERDGRVVVRAPHGTDPEIVERLVESKKRWIHDKIQHPQKYRPYPHPPGKELVSGESMLYRGRAYRIEIVNSPTQQIRFENRFLVPQGVSHRGREAFRDWYVERAKERLVPRTLEWSQRLGVSPSRITVADVRFRWGSCSPTGHVRLNWRLIKAPAGAADYVIVHELAHMLDGSHSDRFWSIIRSQIPKMESYRDWLKEHGQLLEQDV